jgi:hypothetical protein
MPKPLFIAIDLPADVTRRLAKLLGLPTSER